MLITGSDLRMLRLSAKLSQAELAKKLGNGGYDRRIVGAIENNRRNIGINLIADWANACGYSAKIEFEKYEE